MGNGPFVDLLGILAPNGLAGYMVTCYGSAGPMYLSFTRMRVMGAV